jgi:hypothetical protein
MYAGCFLKSLLADMYENFSVYACMHMSPKVSWGLHASFCASPVWCEECMLGREWRTWLARERRIDIVAPDDWMSPVTRVDTTTLSSMLSILKLTEFFSSKFALLGNVKFSCGCARRILRHVYHKTYPLRMLH